MVHPSPTRCYRDCTGVHDLFKLKLEAAQKHFLCTLIYHVVVLGGHVH